MRFTFHSDDRMVITIPLGSLRQVGEGQLMPDTFTCVFKDVYKVFLRAQPKAVGAAQLIAGVFTICLGVLLITATDEASSDNSTESDPLVLIYTLPSILFAVSGLLSYVAGHTPDMYIMKLSFTCNIVCVFWAIAALTLCGITMAPSNDSPHVTGLKAVVAALLAGQMLVAMVMVYWESKAVCRDYFNILPTITLKQDP